MCVCVCASTANLPLSPTCPPACQHASTSHTLTLGRSGSTRDVPAKSSSTSSLDPNTCHTKPWQPATSHYQSYSIYRRYSRPPPAHVLSHSPHPFAFPVQSRGRRGLLGGKLGQCVNRVVTVGRCCPVTLEEKLFFFWILTSENTFHF